MPADDSAPHSLSSRYELHDQIGAGGMGTVFRGVDTQTGEAIAVKLLKAEVAADPAMLKRFIREAEALRQLNHPNIVKVLATVEEDGQHYIVMEYVDGGTLQEVMRRGDPLTIEQVLTIALELADALTRAHYLKIVHRDLKPGNVLMTADGAARLTDFGVARMEKRDRMTETGTAIGTLDYLCPEALEGRAVDTRADIWAFGVLLYEMLTGRRPFEGDTIASTVTAILTQPPGSLKALRPDCPHELDRLISWMLEKSPDDRIASVRQVGAELEAILRGGDTPRKSRFDTPTPSRRVLDGATAIVKTDTQIGPVRTRRWLRFLLTAFGVVGLVLAGAAGALLLTDDGRPAEPAAGADVEALASGLQASVAEALAQEDYVVLVAQVEHVGGAERDVTRFIVDDLRQRLEVSVLFANVAVRQHEGIVRSDAEALQAAEAGGAAVIVWGNYNDSRVRLEVQAGSLAAFPYNRFERSVVERAANVRVEMADEQTQSAAPLVIGVLAVMAAADGDSFEVARALAVIAAIEGETAALTPGTAAANTQRFLAAFMRDPQTASGAIDAAISADPGSPLLYGLRAFGRLNALGRAVFVQGAPQDLIADLGVGTQSDSDTALRLGPAEWTLPMYINFFQDTILPASNVIIQADPSQGGDSLDLINRIVELRPDDWWASYNLLLAYSTVSATPEQLTAVIDQHFVSVEQFIADTLAQHIDASLPYAWIALFMLNAGQLDDAALLATATLDQFPDPALGNRIHQVLFGSPSLDSQLASVFSRIIIGQYEAASQEAVGAVAVTASERHGSTIGYQGTWILNGIAQCSLGSYDLALIAFRAASFRGDASPTAGLALEFYVVELLRAMVEMARNSPAVAEIHLRQIEGSPQAQLLAPYVYGVRQGALRCADLFDPVALAAVQVAYAAFLETTAEPSP